jgi:hypothetical protein
LRRGCGEADLFEDVAGDVGERNGGVEIADIYIQMFPQTRIRPGMALSERVGPDETIQVDAQVDFVYKGRLKEEKNEREHLISFSITSSPRLSSPR